MKAMIATILVTISITVCAQDDVQELLDKIKFNDTKRVAEMIKKHPASANAKGKHGWTPLMQAASDGNMEMVRILISKGADIDAKDMFGFTAIDYLQSILRRTGIQKKKTVERLKKQGSSKEEIQKLMDASAVPGNPSEEDVQQLKAVLEYLKEVKATRENEKNEADKQKPEQLQKVLNIARKRQSTEQKKNCKKSPAQQSHPQIQNNKQTKPATAPAPKPVAVKSTKPAATSTP